jgi:hypothetical protein
MPVLWRVFHASRLVVISAQGVVRLDDMEECVEGIMAPATLSYRKLVHLAEGRLELTRDDVVTLAQFVRERRDNGPAGALAITVASDESEQQVRLFESLSAADRPLRTLRDPLAARAWLDTQPSNPRPPWGEEAHSAEKRCAKGLDGA